MSERGVSLQIGLLINPMAGVGGSVALMGSDGPERQAQALALGAETRAQQRVKEFLSVFAQITEDATEHVHWHTWGGAMGAAVLAPSWQVTVHGQPQTPHSQPQDTAEAARQLLNAGIDLLVFAGGDGTARDLLAELGAKVPVLGIPAGVKMHSGVFAVSPRSAARVISELVQGGMVAPLLREVKDFDDAAGQVSTAGPGSRAIPVRVYGEMKVPDLAGYLQHTKVGGVKSEPLAVAEICADLIDNRLQPDTHLVVGPGSSCAALKEALGLPVTLRGFDLRRADHSVRANVTAQELELLQPTPGTVQVVLSFTRNQGFLFGRGNQQLSAPFLRALGWPGDVLIIGTRTKLASLAGRPLLVDSGDVLLDEHLCGLIEVITGYEDCLMYRLATDLAG
ncbi:MAG: NAD(+)/NADH kinase [Pseudomonadota bacterium]